MVSRRRHRERSQWAWRVFIWLAALLAVVVGLLALGASAYRTGQQLASVQVRALEGERDRLTEALATAIGERDAAQRRFTETDTALAALQKRYDDDVPAGVQAEIYALIRQRLAAGLPPERLSEVVRTAEPQRVCEGRVQRKRLAIQTGQPRAAEAGSFLDGMLTVAVAVPTAESAAPATTVAIGAAWLEQPATLTGMPARYDVVLNNLVLRLVVEQSEMRGYANATLATCAPRG